MKSTDFEPFSKGELIDKRYRVDDVKRGNMGIVYLCTDTHNNDPVAIKTFDGRFVYSETSLQSFLNEASTWIHLERHPNIVEARSLKIIDDHPYLFLERVVADNPRGATLKDLFFTQTLDYKRMLQIAIHICDGMIHALNKFPNLVHRDLKSENILFGYEGLPKVSDFGMTVRPELEDAAPLEYQFDLDLPFHPSELARRMEGTPAYASPEQCQCQPLDTRSDIYSFGCILYHMTTRHLPFHSATVEDTILAHIRETPAPPCERNNMIPGEFSKLILQCLEKNPLDRFDSFDSARMELIDLYEFNFYERPNSFQYGVPLTVDEYLERAKSFAALHQYEHARSELMNAVHLEPSRFVLYYYLGRYSFLEGQYDRALLELNEGLRGMSDSIDLHDILGKTYLARDCFEEAEMHFRKALEYDADNASVYHSLVDLNRKKGNPKQAEVVLLDAIRDCKNNLPFYMRLARLYEITGKTDREYDVLEKAVQIDSDWEALEEEEFNQGKYNRVGCLLRLAELNLQSKRNHQAFERLDCAAKCRPTKFHDLFKLGRLYLQVNNPRLAVEYWKHAAATGEGDGSFYIELASLLVRMRSYDEAWRSILRAEEKGEDVGSMKFEIQARRLKGR